jgi:hypothetical protein
MALGVLFLMCVGINLLGILGSIALFLVKKRKASDILMALMTLLSLFVAYLGATGEPSNFIFQRILHWVIGLIAVLGIGVRLKMQKPSVYSKVLVVVSVLGGIYYAFFNCF